MVFWMHLICVCEKCMPKTETLATEAISSNSNATGNNFSSWFARITICPVSARWEPSIFYDPLTFTRHLHSNSIQRYYRRRPKEAYRNMLCIYQTAAPRLNLGHENGRKLMVPAAAPSPPWLFPPEKWRQTASCCNISFCFIYRRRWLLCMECIPNQPAAWLEGITPSRPDAFRSLLALELGLTWSKMKTERWFIPQPVSGPKSEVLCYSSVERGRRRRRRLRWGVNRIWRNI